MTISTSESLMTSDLVTEHATFDGTAWRLSWLPEHALSHRQALLVMQADEALSGGCPDGMAPAEIGALLAAEGGISLLEVIQGLTDRSVARWDAILKSEFSQFYREFTPNLVAFLVRNGAQTADAADLAQETLIDAFRSWKEISTPDRWCFRVAFRKFLRMKATHREEPSSDRVDVGTTLLGAAALGAVGELDDLQRLLNQLPPRQRQVLACTMFGFSHYEIAASLVVSQEAVRANLMKARRSLKALIEQERREQ